MRSFITIGASLVAQTVKNLPAVQETQVQSLGQEDPLEKGMATHSSILAWRIPWTEDRGGLQSMRACMHAQSCQTLCDPMDYSLPGTSVQGILQARIPEWIAMPFSTRGLNQVSCIAGRFLTI